MNTNENTEAYSKQFVSKLMKKWESESKITGTMLLEFSPIKAYNFLIVQNLMINWKIELQRLESPYFDFKNEEVKSGLKKFANLLSRHILIEKKDFVNLAESSLKQLINLIYSPYQYFNQLILREEIRQLPIKDFEDTVKYIKINQHVMDSFIKSLKSKGSERVFGENEELERIFETLPKAPENPDPWTVELSQILPFDPHILIENVPETKNQPSQKTILKKEEDKLHEPFLSEEQKKQALYEKFQTEQKTTLAEIHQNRKIESIRKALNLNQRFMVINALFEGNEEQFNITLEKIESCTSESQAFEYLGKEFNWNQDTEEVIEFLELVHKRFTN